jgi:hypothetical protein
MRLRAGLRFFFAFALLGVGAGCTYDPHPKDGQEECSSDGRCPYGYDCAIDRLCYSWGHLPPNPGTGGSISKTGGSSGKGGSSGAGGMGGVTGGNAIDTGGVIDTGGAIVAGGGAGIPDTGSGPPTGGAVVGTGGATFCTPNTATGSNPLVDDIADGDTVIITQDGRSGGWYTYSDKTGTLNLSSKPGQICASGSGFSNWGAGLGISINSDPTKACTYDASIYKGIRFSILGSITDGIVRFSVQTADIAEAVSSGTCVSTSATSDNCNDTYGVSLTGQTAGGVTCQSTTQSWPCGPATGVAGPVTVTVPFSYMSQEGWGQVFPTFNPKIMLGLQWQFKNCVGATCYTDTSFDMCVGNVSFY